MAVPFNGVFLSREASMLLPTAHFNTVVLNNITPNHLIMDRGGYYDDTKTEITPNKNNILDNGANMWHPNTELNADFNGTLEGGTLNTFGEEIQGLVIRRTSSRSGFSVWEDVYAFPLTPEDVEHLSKQYSDIFVESGVIYKYAIQTIAKGVRGPVFSSATSMLDYDHAWLIGAEENQIMFAFNPVISNYTVVTKDTIIETIGSKYPYVTRNANVAYKQFQFSATITHFMDVEKNIINDSNPFVVSLENPNLNVEYENFYKTHNMDSQNNYILEREFRNELEKFLYDGNPKVFKSDTEGLILVRLSNIILTPKTELGRVIYDMSCTMSEIGEVDFDTLVQYNIKKGVTVHDITGNL